MNCNQIRELLPDLAAGMDASTPEPEVEKHIASCADCAAHLRDLQKTMALLDEWQAPEPSPYFDTRLQARLREEMARPPAGWPSGWFNWLRRPAWAMSLAAVLFAGALVSRQQVVYFSDRSHRDQASIARSAGAAGNRRRRSAGAGEERRVVRRFRCARRTAGAGRRNRESVRLQCCREMPIA